MKDPILVSIVDDDTDLRQQIGAFIDTIPGLRCLSGYASAEEALTRLPKDQPDVVLMDINLTGLNGIECVRRLKPLMPNTQIVMLTVFEDTEKIFSAVTAGASGYLLKRLAPAKLAEAIVEVHEGGSPMSAPIARKVVQYLQRVPARSGETADLSQRERQVLDGLAAGRVYKQIADELGVSINTVRTYIRRIYEKLHVQSRTEAVAKYLQS